MNLAMAHWGVRPPAKSPKSRVSTQNKYTAAVYGWAGRVLHKGPSRLSVDLYVVNGTVQQMAAKS